jgi:hypothetical protein
MLRHIIVALGLFYIIGQMVNSSPEVHVPVKKIFTGTTTASN